MIAHELSKELADFNPAEYENVLRNARDTLFQLSNFWTYIEIGSDPEFTSYGIDWATVHGADLTLLDLLLERTRHLRLLH